MNFLFWEHKNTSWGIIIGILSIICFSLYTIFAKTLLPFIEPYTLLGFGQLLSVILLLFFVGTIPEIKEIVSLSKKQIFWLALNASIVGVTSPVLFLSGLEYSTSSNAVIISSTESLFLTLFGVLFLKEKIKLLQIIGMICMMVGMYIIATNTFQHTFSLDKGSILILLSVFIGTVGSTIFKKFLSDIPPQTVLFFRNGLGSLILLGIIPLFLETNHSLMPLVKNDMLILFIGYTLIVILSAQFLWYKSFKILSTFSISILLLTLPLFGILFSISILKETLLWSQIWGGVAILLGMGISIIHFKDNQLQHKARAVKQFHH